MTTGSIVICTLIFVVIVAILIYLKYFMPLRPKEIGFEYVYVKDDGTIIELNEKEAEYLKTEFDPSDGARPYIKNRYNQLTPDNKISGFIQRNRVPKRFKINTLQNLQEKRTISWIYLALAIASETAPTNFQGISMIADGINHAVPTSHELQSSLSWLLNNKLVIKNGNKYALTSKGRSDYKMASEKTNTLLKTWENMEEIVKSYV